MFPEWLPDPLKITSWSDCIIEELYSIFTKDFKESRPVYNGQEVWYFSELEKGKEKIFWHLITQKDEANLERSPDVVRAEKIPWVKSIINNSDKPEITVWDVKERRKRVNTYLWLREHNFVVILRKYKNGSRRLLTAFSVDYNHQRVKLERKFNRKI